MTMSIKLVMRNEVRRSSIRLKYVEPMQGREVQLSRIRDELCCTSLYSELNC